MPMRNADEVCVGEFDIESLRLMHIERGGNYTWAEIVDQLGLPLPPDALRKRVQRHERRIKYTAQRTTPGGYVRPLAARLAMAQTSPINSLPPSQRPAPQLRWDEPVQTQVNPYANTPLQGISMPQPGRVVTDAHLNQNAYQDTEVYGLRREVERLQRMLEHSGMTPVSDDELMYEPYPPHLDDTASWESWQDEFARQTDIARVAVLTDIHFPDHSPAALALAMQLVEKAQPQIVIHGGDMFDFDALSTFAHSRRRRFKDAIEEVNGLWANTVLEIKRRVPGVIQVAFRGNHDTRIDRWNDMNSNPFADTTEETFVEMVRCGGNVMWLGQLQETHVGSLFIQHGKRVGENAAKSAAKDQGWATSLIQGHNHRPGVFIHRVNNARNLADYRVVMSVSSGALCNIPPAYQLDTRQSTWLHGIVIAHVDMHGEDVNLQNIIFHRNREGKLWAVYGNEVVQAGDPGKVLQANSDGGVHWIPATDIQGYN